MGKYFEDKNAEQEDRHMKSLARGKSIGMGLITCGLLGAAPFPLAAQEATPQQEGPGGHMETHGMRGKHEGMRAEMRQHHEQMEKMHQEMNQELQQQLAALRAHARAMEGMTEEKQLLTEMKKHQQMTDQILGTMVEQREKMHAEMRTHHEEMHPTKGKAPQAESPSSGGHEAHH
jgi:hypothetical protein